MNWFSIFFSFHSNISHFEKLSLLMLISNEIREFHLFNLHRQRYFHMWVFCSFGGKKINSSKTSERSEKFITPSLARRFVFNSAPAENPRCLINFVEQEVSRQISNKKFVMTEKCYIIELESKFLEEKLFSFESDKWKNKRERWMD